MISYENLVLTNKRENLDDKTYDKRLTHKSKSKIVMTVTFCIITLALGACGYELDSSSNDSPTTKVEETANDDNIEQANESVSENDMEIITRNGHPTYYGSVEQSHNIWDDVEKGKIHFADENYGYNDNPVLTMDCNRNEDIIRSIYISFSDFEEKPQLSIDETLPIVASYMPFDVMDKWYEFETSKMIVPDDKNSGKDTVYLVSYRLTEVGNNAYDSKEHSYSGSIDVMISVKDNIVQNVNITFGTPKWMSYLEKNGYHTEEWNCDLYDYK